MRFYNFICHIAVTLWLMAIPVAGETIHASSRTILLPYDSQGAFALGDGFDLNGLSGPRGNCIELKNEDIKKDVPRGTSEIRVSISVVKNIDDLETKLNRSFSVEASLSGNYLKFARGEAHTSLSRTYGGFLKDIKSSLIISIRIVADHGRTWLDYRLRPEMRQLISNDHLDRFREKCGSHFVRAVRRESALDYDVIVTGLSRTTKDMLAREASTKFEAQGGSGNISSSAHGSVQHSLRSFVAVARHFGKISVEARLVGAPSIAILARTLPKSDVTDAKSVDELFSNWDKVVEGFQGSEGAPREFILVRYDELPPHPQADRKFVFLGEVAKRLMLVEQLLREYESFRKNEAEELWDIYFGSRHKNLKALRDRLIGEYDNCALQDKCDAGSLPDEVVGSTIDDVLYNGKLKATCGWEFEAQVAGRPTAVLSDMVIYWHGWMNFPKFVDWGATVAFRIDASGKRHDMEEFEPHFDMSVHRPEGNAEWHGPDRAIIQFLYRSLGEGEVLRGGVVNHAFLREQQAALRKSQFGIVFHFPSGRVVAQNLGLPDFSQCERTRGIQ